MSSGYFVEILTDLPVSTNSPDPADQTGVDIEVVLGHASTVNEMPGPEAIEITEPVAVRPDYSISATEPTDPAVLIWYKIL